MSERLCAECGRWRATIGHTRLSGWPPEPLTSDPVVCQLCFFEDKRRALERMRSREELRRAVAELVAIEPEPDMTLAEGELSTGFRVGPQAPYDSEVWPEVPPELRHLCVDCGYRPATLGFSDADPSMCRYCLMECKWRALGRGVFPERLEVDFWEDAEEALPWSYIVHVQGMWSELARQLSVASPN